MNDNPTRRLLKLPERNLELALLDWGGDGPLALLAHATGFCAATLSPVAQRLCSRYRVIGYDHRGHGNSTKLMPPQPYQWDELILDLVAVAKTLLQEFNMEQIGLGIGHSVGACCMFAAAARYPELFMQVALIDPVVMPPVGERTEFYAGEGKHPMAEAARRRRAVFASREEARQRWAERGIFGDWNPQALQGYLEDGFHDRPDGHIELQCAPEVEAAIYEAGPNFHIFSEVKNLRIPTTLYHAARGPFRWDLVGRLAAQSEYLRLVSIEGDHLAPMTAPELVAERLKYSVLT